MLPTVANVAFLPFFLLTVVASPSNYAPLDDRSTAITATTILNDLKSIDSGVQELISATKAYTGGLAAVIPVYQATVDIHNANQIAISNVTNGPSYGTSDSNSIASYISSVLAVDIPNSVQLLVNKKAQFAADGYSSSVVSQMQSMLSDEESLVSALKNVLTTAAETSTTKSSTTIENALQSGISAFSH